MAGLFGTDKPPGPRNALAGLLAEPQGIPQVRRRTIAEGIPNPVGIPRLTPSVQPPKPLPRYYGPQITWTGASGGPHKFQVYPIGTQFFAMAGVYIFCLEESPSIWQAIYVGESDSFKRRLTDELDGHHRIECIRRRGATHICTLPIAYGPTIRRAIETDLRQSLDPPCNRQ